LESWSLWYRDFSPSPTAKAPEKGADSPLSNSYIAFLWKLTWNQVKIDLEIVKNLLVNGLLFLMLSLRVILKTPNPKRP